MESLKRRIYELAGRTAAGHEVEIVDVTLAGNARRPLIRVFIDKDQGVSLDDCTRFSRALSSVLDVEDLIKTSYVLEVSSPGLDRPLKNRSDFERSLGKLARISTSETLDGQNFFLGRLRLIKDESILVELDKGREISIPFKCITKARLEIEL